MLSVHELTGSDGAIIRLRELVPHGDGDADEAERDDDRQVDDLGR